MTDIEPGITIDSWKENISNIINIEKSRINYIKFEGAGLILKFSITPSESDNLTELYSLFDSKYNEISEIYPYIYEIDK
jgi:hypothetical protein